MTAGRLVPPRLDPPNLEPRCVAVTPGPPDSSERPPFWPRAGKVEARPVVPPADRVKFFRISAGGIVGLSEGEIETNAGSIKQIKT